MSADDDMATGLYGADVILRMLDESVRGLEDPERVEAGLMALGFARAAFDELTLISVGTEASR